MYNSFFGFAQSPFASVPLAEHYFPAAAIESARAKLARCAERGEGIGMVLGRSGVGKTLLCHVLREGFRSRFQVALLPAGRLSTRRSLFQALLYSLGKPYRGMDEGDLRLSLMDLFSDVQQYPNGVLLLVDEADTLPLRLLDEIRLFLNLSADGRPRVRLILFGACRLEERLNSPRLESLNQLVVARCYLEPFTQTETQQYIHARIKAVGGVAGELFPAEACRSIHVATDGVPRLINQLCDHTLLLAYVGGYRRIEPALVEEAWRDLQQLPVPMSRTEAQCQDSAAVIEFGQLEESVDIADHHRPEADPPALRIVSEGVSGNEAVPTVRLAAIENMVESIDDEFRPAGTIKPEVDLFFGDDEFPLAQRFDEEELVEVRVSRRGQGHPCGLQNPAASVSALPHAEHNVAPNAEGFAESGTQRNAAATAEANVEADTVPDAAAVLSSGRAEPAGMSPWAGVRTEDAAPSGPIAGERSAGPTSCDNPVLQPGDSRATQDGVYNPPVTRGGTECLPCFTAEPGWFPSGAQVDWPVQYMPARSTCAIVPARQRRFARLFSSLKWA